MSTTKNRPPKGWRTQADESLVCLHRDLSVCPSCEAAHDEVVDVYGQCWWMADPDERAAFRAEMEAAGPL